MPLVFEDTSQTSYSRWKACKDGSYTVESVDPDGNLRFMAVFTGPEARQQSRRHYKLLELLTEED